MTDKFGTKMTNIEWLTDQAAKLRVSANPCAGETPLTAMADRFDRTANEIIRLRAGLSEARELLIEVKQGSPARSPNHNARLVIDAALQAS